MRYSILVLSLAVFLGNSTFAQTADSSAKVSNKTSVSKNSNGATLESGTQIAAQLQNSLDVKKAKVGDQVVLKTTKAIKQNGQVVVDKGTKLFGKVTEVKQKTKGEAGSKISVLFDSLQNERMTTPISATIVSLTQLGANANVNDNAQADVYGSSSSRTATRSSNNNGGLLGGVTNTVGGVVNTTTNTVGGVTDTVGQTVGNTTNAVGGNLKGIQISQSSDTSVDGSSTLSLNGGNLRLEKGTTFNLRLTESVSVNK